MKTCLLMLATLLSASATHAAVLQLDFAGTSDVGDFQAQFILDTSVPDIAPWPDFARYEGAVMEGDFVWAGVAYEFIPGSNVNEAVVRNDGPRGDFFAAIAAFIGPDGSSWLVVVEFYDGSATVFDSEQFPTSFTLSNFDAYDGSTTTTSYTIYDIGGPFFRGPITSATLSQVVVPLPGAFALFLSGVAGLSLLRRRIAG